MVIRAAIKQGSYGLTVEQNSTYIMNHLIEMRKISRKKNIFVVYVAKIGLLIYSLVCFSIW